MKKTKGRIRKRIVPKVFKSIFGNYYVLSDEMFSQEELEEAYIKQNGKK